MSRLRDHRVRMDATFCPDPAGCARLYHGALESGLLDGDSCECCGGIVRPLAVWEPVRADSTNDSSRVVYWRLMREGVKLGAVSRKPEGWRALRYGAPGLPKDYPVELGFHPTQAKARRAVEEATS